MITVLAQNQRMNTSENRNHYYCTSFRVKKKQRNEEGKKLRVHTQTHEFFNSWFDQNTYIWSGTHNLKHKRGEESGEKIKLSVFFMRVAD